MKFQINLGEACTVPINVDYALKLYTRCCYNSVEWLVLGWKSKRHTSNILPEWCSHCSSEFTEVQLFVLRFCGIKNRANVLFSCLFPLNMLS